jgi:membrane-bound hydrogenase subunit beta
MANEEKIVTQLTEKFDFLREKSRVPRERRIFMDVIQEKFWEVFPYVVGQMDFTILCTITGLDEGENLGLIYHLARFDGTMLNLKTWVPKTSPKLKTVSEFFPSAVLYEKELIDLLGAEVSGLPADFGHYPLPEDWPKGQYPLRKDWKPEMLDEKK